MSVIGVKQLKLWFISGTGSRPLNPRGFTVDFQNNGEPDTAVFRNLIESVTNKRNGDDFQDQAMYSDINTRTVPDKFVTPNNLPVTAAPSGSVVSVTPVAATDELASGNPYVTYNLDVHKATYGDIMAGNTDVALTGANYPTVTSTTLTVTPVQDGNSIDYQVELPALPSIQLITDITYTALVNLINTSALVPGTWYRFPYQCIHQIPYTNVLNTSSTLTIPTEHLLVQAINTNTLDRTQVRSMEHPQDIIHWRWEDNLVVTPTNEAPLFTQTLLDTIDPSNPNRFTVGTTIIDVIPNVSRPGRIYYREDTIQRISTPYDFRGVVYRRWALTKDGSGNYIINNALVFTPTTLYKHHDIILDSGIYYIVIFPFTATASIGNHTYNLTSLNTTFNSSTGNTPQFIAANPTSCIIFNTDDQYFTSTKVEFVVDSTTFQDHFTFYNSTNTLQAFNVKIKDYVPAWIEAVTWEFYPNIVFDTWLSGNTTPITNVYIDSFSYDLTMYNVTSVNIGSYCRDIFINGRANGNIGNIDIKDNNQYIYLDQFSSGGESILTKRLVTNIGYGNRGLLLYGGAFRIEDNNNRLLSVTGTNTIIGTGNYVLGNISGSNEFGDFNSFFVLNSCVLNKIGNRNRNVFSVFGTNTTFGDFNTDITTLKPNTIEGVAVPHIYNKIGDYCSNIIMSGSSNYFNRTSNLTYSNLIVLNNCIFDITTGITFTSTSATYTYNNVLFRNVLTTTFTDSVLINSTIEDSSSIATTTVSLNSVRIKLCSSLSITSAAISSTSFENVNSSSILLGATSTIAYSKFEKISSLSINYLVITTINNLQISNGTTINLTSTLSTPSSLSINYFTINNFNSINILELSNGINKVLMNNITNFAIKYPNLINSSFITINNLDFSSAYPLSLVAANNQISIFDCLFENIDGITLTPATNDGSGITQHKIGIVSSEFISLKTITLNTLASSVQNVISFCKFNNIQTTNFSSVPNNASATRQMNYIQSEFENLQGNLTVISLNTPSISYSSIKGFNPPATGIVASIAYRIALVRCKFEGNISILDNVGSPDYTQVSTLTNCEGGGYYVKNSNTSVSKTGFKVNKRINFTTVGINIDSAPADVSDTNYEVIDSTKLYGIQNVISGGNIVQTPVNLTLI